MASWESKRRQHQTNIPVVWVTRPASLVCREQHYEGIRCLRTDPEDGGRVFLSNNDKLTQHMTDKFRNKTCLWTKSCSSSIVATDFPKTQIHVASLMDPLRGKHTKFLQMFFASSIPTTRKLSPSQ